MYKPKIAFHGGKCCGVKTIHTLGYRPDDIAPALEREKCRPEVKQNADQYGHEVSSDFNFYNGDAPAETCLERVKRYVAFIDKIRPYGIIEIILADSSSPDFDQVDYWGSSIEELGFVKVSDCFNSNSSNRVYVYHRKTDKV